MILDIIFSLDSVITAVGMVNNLYVMVAAVIIAVIVMLVAVALVGEGPDFHIPKGYIYFAMFLSSPPGRPGPLEPTRPAGEPGPGRRRVLSAARLVSSSSAGIPTPMLTDPPSAGPSPKPRKQWPWYRPVVRNWRRYYLRQFPRKKRLHGGFLHRVLGNRLFDPGLWLPTRDTVAWGVAIGTFIGLMPFMGLQIVLSMLLCFAFRVNITAAVVATFISNPLTAVQILYLQRLVGMQLAGPVNPSELEMYSGILRAWVEYGKPIMLGAVVTGFGAAVAAYVVTLLLWTMFSKAAIKAIAARQAKKAAHSPPGHAGHGPESPAATVPGGPGGGLGLAGEPFPDIPGKSPGAEKD